MAEGIDSPAKGLHRNGGSDLAMISWKMPAFIFAFFFALGIVMDRLFLRHQKSVLHLKMVAW